MTRNAKNIKPFDEQNTNNAAGKPLSRTAAGLLHGAGSALGTAGIAAAGLLAVNEASKK